jgi:alkylated DNA repair dioxygenase AlkB
MSFSNQTRQDRENFSQVNVERIPGLTYIPNYLSDDEQGRLINIIDRQEWVLRTERRVQHYGYRYDEKNGSLASTQYLGILPDWLQTLAQQFHETHLTPNLFDQVIVNEYQPGQGIINHIDCIPCFGNTIITLSLGSACVMDFTHSRTQERKAILLSPGSLLIFQKAARTLWQHGIAAHQVDSYQGKELVRTRRVSLTFREVLFPYK